MSKFKEAIRKFPKTSEGGYGFIKDHNCAVYKALRIAAAVEKHLPELKELDVVGGLATGGEWAVGMYALSVEAEYEADGTKWHMKILDIRGWGHLIGKGCARRFSEDKAKAVQESNAQFITKAANSRNVIKDILKEME